MWGLLFTPTVERVQEAEHAHTKQAIIHRGKISPAYVSCRLRFPEIREIIDNPPELKSLLSAFKIIKDPNSLAKLFGFWNHPLWQKSVQQNYSKMLKMQLAATILYSGDPESQYAKDVQNKRRRKDQKKAMEQRVKKALRAYGNLGKGMSWSHGNVERVSIAHHLQERLEMGNLYSLSQQSLNFPTLPQAQMPLQGLEEKRYPVSQEPALQIQAEPWQSLQPLGPESETSAAIVLADDADKDKAPGQLSVEKVVFLRIVKSKPSSLRNVDLPAAETKRLGSTDMCVSFHKARMAPTIQGQDPSLCVSVEPTVAMGVPNTVAVLSVCGSSNIDVDLGPLTQSMRCWMIDKQLQFALRDYTVSAAASHLLRDAVLGRAFPNCSREQWLVLDTSNDAVMAAAKELQALGIFEPQSLAGGSACFALTPRGVQQLHHMHAVQHPEKVFRSAETLAALPAPQMLECTSWELMQILKHQGWEMKKCPAGQKRRGLPPITRSTVERKFYLSSLHAHSKHHMAYMKALCQAETLFEHGVVHAIHHGQNPTYYQAILDEAHDGVIAPVPLAIEAGGSAEIAAAIPMQLELDEHIVLAVNPARPALRESDIVTNQDPLDNFCASKGQESALEKESVCSDPGNSADSAESWTPEFVPSSDEGANQSPVGDPPQSPTASHDITPPDPDLPRPPDILGPAETGTPRGSDNQVAETQPPQEPLTMDDGTLRRDAWVTREKHPDSFHWGVFRFTFTPASKRPPYGQFQAKCPYHQLNPKTSCTRAMQVGPSSESRDLVIRTLQSWCLLAAVHNRKRHHTSAFVSKADVLPQALLDERLKTLSDPPTHVPTDIELDALDRDNDRETADARAGKASSSRPGKASTAKGQAKAASKAKAKPKAKDKGLKQNPERPTKKRKLDLGDACSESKASEREGDGISSSKGKSAKNASETSLSLSSSSSSSSSSGSSS